MTSDADTAGPASEVRTTGPARGVLHVLNSHGGGTERHVLALIAASGAHLRHYVAITVGDHWQVEDHGDGGEIRSFDFRRLPGEEWPDFLRGLAATFRIDFVHLHNISGCDDGLFAALPEAGLPYGYTVHDLGFACPTVILLGVDGLYCGAETDAAACTRCLNCAAAASRASTSSRGARDTAGCLAGSAFVVAPSRWAAATLARYFPEQAVEVIPHGAPAVSAPMAPDSAPPVRTAMPLPDDDGSDDRGARCDRPPQGRATARATGRARSPQRNARSLRRHRLSRRTARPVAERRCAADRARSVRFAGASRAARPIPGRARRVSFHGTGNVQLHAVGSVGGRPARGRSADRRARGARGRQRCGLGLVG